MREPMTASDTISARTGLSCAALLETRLVELSSDTLSFPEAAVFYHLMADGQLQTETSLPVLLPGEGSLVCCGDFYIEPLEIQIEFSKANNATDWLVGLLLCFIEPADGADRAGVFFGKAAVTDTFGIHSSSHSAAKAAFDDRQL